MVGPWPPSTVPATSSTDTSSSMAMKARQRPVSSTPAMPQTWFLGKPVTFWKT